MAQTFTNIQASAKDPNFQGMSEVACQRVAESILAENPPAAADRITWANRMLKRTYQTPLATIAYVLLQYAPVQVGAAAQDADMINAVLNKLNFLVELG